MVDDLTTSSPQEQNHEEQQGQQGPTLPKQIEQIQSPYSSHFPRPPCKKVLVQIWRKWSASKHW